IALAIAGGVLAADRAFDGVSQQVTITGRDFRFEPAEVTVRAGEWVVVEFTNDDTVIHDWMVEGIPNVDVPARPGQTARLRFVLDTPGTYMVMCSIPGHAEAGMTGTLVVTAP
ncbi:MAG TPA: cupredoxin domain-containing protein, partial [Candidatus Limnocylindrales bacterium]|nr:cupredoxin domain-containing protein [Candidatus Limnocylindrales bacterium]